MATRSAPKDEAIIESKMIVQEYERAVILRLGRILPGGGKGPGLFCILPCVDTIVKIDLRTATFNVPPQEVLTRDSVTVSVDAVVYSRVFNPVISVTNVKNTQYATQLLAQTTLRNILGTKSLQEILSDREAIAQNMQVQLDEGTGPWGVKVERVEVTDIRLPQSIQRSMAAEAEATREARAKVIAAEGEQRASRQLKEAADVIAASPIALQLRYLQTLTQIAAEKNSTIVFPVPIELLNLVVQEYERAVIFRLGRILQGGAKGPGLFFILPCLDSIVKVDLRTTTFNVPPQEILTRDSVTISVDAVVYSRVTDPTASVTKVNNVHSATQLLAQTTLRNILGTKTLQEILSDREAIAQNMQVQLDEGTGPWGVKVERVEITDVRLPQSMQRSMAAEAEATREARAKVIAAEGEQRASRQLKEAADVIATSPIALQLRYLQTLTQISAEKNSTIVFPIPGT
ncbi:unnamed protein product [Rotaria sp. Silwood2]|nr:unnamed protein product [Rotaria sp. Silwood2]